MPLGLLTGLGNRFGVLTGLSGAGAPTWSYTLQARQRALYKDLCDLWERTRPVVSGTPGDEGWYLVASNLPYYHEGSVTLLNPGVTGMATDDDMITTDRGHFPAGIPFVGTPGHVKEQVIVNRSTGSRASLNGTYTNLGSPWNVNLLSNKQVILLRETDFDPELTVSVLAAGTVSAAIASDTAASVTVNAATGGIGPHDYDLEYQADGGEWEAYGRVVVGANIIPDLTPGTTYFFRVTATDQLGVTDTSEASVTLPGTLGAVLSVTGSTYNSVSVSLAITGGVGPYSIQYQYKRSTSGTWLDWGGPTTATTATVTSLLSVTSYDFQAIVTDANSTSVTSNTASRTTDANPLNVGLVLGCPLNGDLLDVSGNGFTLTNNNAAAFVAGLAGSGAVQLVAANSQYLSHASAAALQLNGSSHTIMVRVKLASLPSVFIIASKDNNGAIAGDRSWSLAVYAGSLRYNLFNAAGSVISDPTLSTANLPLNTTLTIFARYNATTGKANIRVNATQSADYTLTGTPTTTNSPVRFGADNNGHYLDGVIDSPTLWSRYLSDAECDGLVSTLGEPLF